MPFDFDPPDGYRNPVRFPTAPANEADFRDSMQILLDQLRDEMNKGASSAVGIQGMGRQAVINGNFDVWQRGTSWTNPNSGTYTADRFISFLVNAGMLPTITHSRQQQTPGELPGSLYFYRLHTDGAGSGFGVNDKCSIETHIENANHYLCGANKKVTVSFWARSNIANKKIGLSVNQNYGTGGAPSATETLVTTAFALTNVWTRYSYTITTNTLAGKTFGVNNDDYMGVGLFFTWGSALGFGAAETFGGAGDIDIAQVQINAGDQALPFQPRSFAEELALCQRYYEKSYSYATTPLTAAVLAGAESKMVPSNAIVNFQSYGKTSFKVKKRVPPSVTIYPYTTPSNTNRLSDATGADLPANSGDVLAVGDDGFITRNNSGATVNTVANNIIFHWTAEADL